MELNQITLKQVFTFIQESVKRHAQEMKANNDKLQEIMDTMPPSNARSMKLREIYKKNQEISKKNYDLNALHINIFKLLQSNREEFNDIIKEKQIVSKHLNSLNSQINEINRVGNNNEEIKNPGLGKEEVIVPIPEDIDSALKLTIEGKIELDTYHPFATNKSFLGKILRHYESNELYEECAKVANLQKFLSN